MCRTSRDLTMLCPVIVCAVSLCVLCHCVLVLRRACMISVLLIVFKETEELFLAGHYFCVFHLSVKTLN